MRGVDVVVLLGYSVGMSLGQVLFKLAADRAAASGSGAPFWRAVLVSPVFFASVLLYAALTLLWVWILSRVGLSKAYPFVVLAFIVTPMLAALVFREALNAWYFLSLGLILGGLGLLFWKGTP